MGRYKKARVEDLTRDEQRKVEEVEEILGFTGDDANDREVERAIMDSNVDDLAAKMIGAATKRAGDRIGGAAGEHDFNYAKSYPGVYGGIASAESQVRTAVKTLAPSDVLGRQAKEFAKEGLRGDDLDTRLTTEWWFRNDSLRQLSRHPKHLEGAKAIDAFNAVYKATPLEGGADAQGGYTVPNIVSSDVLKLIRDASQVFGIARQIPMTSDTLLIPNEATQVVTYWSTTQASVLTGGEPVFGVTTLSAARLHGRATMSLVLLDDANVAVIPFLAQCFVERMGGDLDAQAIEGVGTPFTGVSGAASVVDAAATNGTNGVTLQYGLGTSTIGGLVKVFTKGGEGLSRRDGVFVSGPGVYAKVLAMIDGNGQPIVRLGTVEGAPNNTLFGRPYLVSNRLSATTIGSGTFSVGNLYFGSPSALIFGVRQNMKWEITDQASWANYRADARMVGRFAYAVGVPAAWTKQLGILV
jgi:HK97 family phage major capsid protein